jgi:hypothetical protein
MNIRQPIQNSMMPGKWVKTSCKMCLFTCNMRVLVSETGVVLKIEGDKSSPQVAAQARTVADARVDRGMKVVAVEPRPNRHPFFSFGAGDRNDPPLCHPAKTSYPPRQMSVVLKLHHHELASSICLAHLTNNEIEFSDPH